MLKPTDSGPSFLFFFFYSFVLSFYFLFLFFLFIILPRRLLITILLGVVDLFELLAYLILI